MNCSRWAGCIASYMRRSFEGNGRKTYFVIARALLFFARSNPKHIEGDCFVGKNVLLAMTKTWIVEKGTHDELIAMGGLYSQLYETQFRGERV